jgi:hypothetical protein
MGGAFGLPEDGVAIGWRTRTKPQPAGTKFTIPPVDAPNVRGAADLGFPVNATATGEADLAAFRQKIESGRRERRSWSSTRPGRLDRGRLVDHRRAEVGQAAAPHRAGRADDGSRARRRRRAAGSVRAREGRRVREPAGSPAGRGAGADGAGRRAGRLARSSSTLAMALGATLDYTTAAQVRADAARALGG